MLTVFGHPTFIKVRNLVIIGIISFLIAYFFDQYYIFDKKWFFISDLFS